MNKHPVNTLYIHHPQKQCRGYWPQQTHGNTYACKHVVCIYIHMYVYVHVH